MHGAGGLLQAVQQQLRTDVILGWFVYRPSPSMHPTAQEEAMSSSMTAVCKRLQGQQNAAVLFALVSVQQLHDGASCDFQQRMFQLNSNRYCCPRCTMISWQRPELDCCAEARTEFCLRCFCLCQAVPSEQSLHTGTSSRFCTSRWLGCNVPPQLQHQCQPQYWICSHKLEPIDVHIRCVGQAGSLAQRYQFISPPPILARVPSFTQKTSSSISQKAKEAPRSSVEVSPSMLRTVAHTGLKNQVEAVESIYRKTVRQLEQMAHQACIEGAPR